MATLLKKGRKKAGGEAGASTSTDMATTNQPPAEEELAPARMSAPEPQPDTATIPTNMPRSYGNTSGYNVGATYEPPEGAGDFQLPDRHIAAEPPPSPEPPSGPSGLLSRVLLFSGETTAAERDRAAAEEFEQAIAPVMEYMRAAIPEASTPEEAAQIWSQNQGEITPDPKGGAYVPGDAYDADARVYYRLLRRNYEKNPRPSEKRGTSPHLHAAYNKLGGTKGW